MSPSLDICVIVVYNRSAAEMMSSMKRADLERLLKNNGWWIKRSGGKHDVWTNGTENETIERHREISEPLAKAIIKRRSLK